MIERPERLRPDRRKNALRWWLFLAFHAACFAALVLNYDALLDLAPEIITNNRAQVLLPVWSGLLVLHLWMVLMIDARFSARNRRIRERLAQPLSRGAIDDTPDYIVGEDGTLIRLDDVPLNPDITVEDHWDSIQRG